MKYLLFFILIGSLSLSFKPSKPSSFTFDTILQDTTKLVCGALTKAGTPCKMVVKEGKCRFHKDDKIICNAITKSSKPCQVVVDTFGKKCWRHKSN